MKSAVSDIGITQFATQNFAHQLSSPRKFDARSISSCCKLIEGPGQATGPNHISVAFLGDQLSVRLLSVVGTSKRSIALAALNPLKMAGRIPSPDNW
ncbi:hypothetical protein QUA43_00305 [Microcoleus sp. N9_B4]|uniref:hypothetical protein n=1 Tax=Microcoleus sp. N9_B4 TaxID=3055386 RepID=UPI002FCEB7B0